MATIGTSRPSATGLLAMAALLAVLALAAAPARASQLNFYGKPGCAGGILKACFDRACCPVPDGAASFQFYYNPLWRGYLYEVPGCTGFTSGILDWDVPCSNLVDFKSAFLSDTPRSLLKMATGEE